MRLRSEAHARVGDVTDAAIDAVGDEPEERAAARHAQALASLEAFASGDALTRVRIDRLRDADDPADAWVKEALASGAHPDDVNADAVRAAFEGDEPSDLHRAAFAQVYAHVADGDDDLLPLDRLRAMPVTRAYENALAESNLLTQTAIDARAAYDREIADARASRQGDVDDAAAEVSAAAAEVSKLGRGFKRVTPSGAPDTWNDEQRAKYDAHAAKFTAARERDATARSAAADLDASIAASVDRTPLDEAESAATAANARAHAVFEADRGRARDLALYAAIPVRGDTLSTLSERVRPFGGDDLTKLSAWADQSIDQRGWNVDDDRLVLTETRGGLTLSMVRLPRGGWGVVGLTPELRRETTVAANLQRGAGGL